MLTRCSGPLLWLLASSVALGQAEPPPLVKDCYISTGDNHWLATSLPIDSPASIAASFDLLKSLGVRRIYWRGLQEAAFQATMHCRRDNFRYATFIDWSRHLIDEVKVEKLAVAAAHQRGMELWGVGTLGDWGCTADTPGFGDYPWFWESRLRLDHPEWVPVDKYGYRQQGGNLELAYPEARAALVELHARLTREAGYDGVLFITYVENFSMRFPDEFAYNEPIVREFQRTFGRDPRIDPFTKNVCRTDYHKFRGNHLTQYLRELKAALPPGTGLGLFINPREPHYPQVWSTLEQDYHTLGQIYLDLETWVAEGTVDQLVVYGSYNGVGQPKTISDMLWLCRDTGTQVGFCTSSPTAAVYQPFGGRAAAVVALAEDHHYLTRCGLPEQEAGALKAGTLLDRMVFLAQVAEGRSKASVAAILPFVQDENLIVRRLAIGALAAVGDPQGVPAIEEALADPEPSVRGMAMAMLRTHNRPESAARILAVLHQHQEHPFHEAARDTLPRIKPPQHDALRAAAGDADPVVRTTALRALRLVGVKDEDVPLLTAHLADPHRYAAYSSAEALGSVVGSPAAVRALIAATRHADAAIADRAATSLAAMMARSDEAAGAAREEILAAASALFGQFGDGCRRADAEWGYRPAGELLLTFGPSGEDVLRAMMAQDRDRRLAELAWRVLYFREKAGPNEFRFTTEAESDLAFQVRPAWLPRLRRTRLGDSFDDPGRFPPGHTGMTGDARRVTGRWGVFGGPGPVLDPELARSPPHSVRLVAAGRSVHGYTVNDITDGRDWEVELWLRRDAEAGLHLVAKGRSPTVVAEAEVLVAEDGRVRLRDMTSGEWRPTGLTVPAAEWVRLRLITARALGSCYATVAAEQAEEQVGDVRAPVAIRSDLYVVEMSAVGPNAVRVDDVSLLERL